MGIRKIVCLLCLISVTAFSQEKQEESKYERNSLYMLMVKHPKYAYNKEIEYVFSTMEKPDRFYDHSLKVKSVIFSSKDKDLSDEIADMTVKTQLGKRMVGKWFNRDKKTGAMDMELIKERGVYNASAADWALANKSHRGKALLEDAGEQLIDNTFLVMNDIRYVDRSTTWNTIKEVAAFASSVGVAVVAQKTGVNVGMLASDSTSVYDRIDWLYANVTDQIKGFSVNVTSYLFKLKWDEESANDFFANLYTDSTDYDKNKVKAWNNPSVQYQLEYIGKIENKSSKTVMSGVQTNEDLIRKVCTRALDKNLAELQHMYEAFRIKAPLLSADPIRVQIGMKEDVEEDSRFEVLERVFDEDGKVSFKRVGVIRPVKGKIWDNRFMATEEQAEGSEFGFTTFEKVSGGDFYQGMLIRELK